MKKKVFSTLFALVLACSFSLVTAMPAGAVTPPHDRTTAILAAADRLVETQNTDGGFTWYLSEPPTGDSGDNVLGITAIGILKAYELEEKTAEQKAAYETALAEAYGYAKVNTARYVYPDVTFLVWLADAAEADASLLAEIVVEVPATTIQDIRTLAQSIWTTRMAGGRLGTDGLNLDAAGRAVEDLEYRVGRDEAGLGFWDLEAAVKAALALENPTDAQAIAGVMYANLQSESPYYFDITDTSTICYVLALSGTIEAFLEVGVYPTMARAMADELIAFQDETGFWDEVAAPMWFESVQSTAYAVMALVAQGDPDALVAAQSGSDWLVNTQHELGGWNPCEKDWPVELLEGDSEAAWALASVEAPVTIGIGVDAKGYYSIQSAIDSATAGDTINVAAGTYNEGIIVIDKELAIVGDPLDKPVIKPTQNTGNVHLAIGLPDGRGWFGITGGPVAFENLVFDGDGQDIVIAVLYHVGSSGGTVKNCDFKNIKYTQYKGRGIGNYGGYVEVVDTTFTNIERIGVFTGIEGAESLIKGCTYTGKGDGAYLDYAFEVGEGAHATIEDNTITACYGEESGWDSAGIYVHEAFGPGTSATITGNTISGCNHGIVVGYINLGSTSTVVAHYNNLTGNDSGVTSIGPQTPLVDAKYNWWGSAVESEVQTMVSGNVDYSPWWGASYLTGTAPNIELVAHPWTWYTNDSIQAAINAADTGDTINVAPGTYKERITIEKELVIQSTDGVENTIIDGNGVGNNVVNIWWKNVTFQGFTVTNPTLGACADAGGIYVQDPANSDAKLVSNVYVLNNIVEATKSASEGTSSYGPAGIVIGPSSNVTVAGNIIRNLHNCPDVETDHTTGINVWGNDEASRPFDIVISNNVISDTDDYGILLEYASDVQIENNTVTGCDAGIRTVDATNVSVNFNNIFGNQTYGVNNGGTDVLDAENNWWGTLIGSDIAEMVSDYVDYSLWLDAPYPDGEPTSLDVTTISLASGWNLISLPLIPADPKIETVLAGADVTVNKVAYYTGGPDGSWQFYTLGVTSNLEQMNDGWGYWVDMETTTATLTISGYEYCKPAPAMPPDYDLVEGWNLIGFKSLSPIKAGTYLDELEPIMRAMYGYDTTSDVYTVIQTSTELVPGKGYWLAVSEAGTIYP